MQPTYQASPIHRLNVSIGSTHQRSAIHRHTSIIYPSGSTDSLCLWPCGRQRKAQLKAGLGMNREKALEGAQQKARGEPWPLHCLTARSAQQQASALSWRAARMYWVLNLRQAAASISQPIRSWAIAWRLQFRAIATCI